VEREDIPNQQPMELDPSSSEKMGDRQRLSVGKTASNKKRGKKKLARSWAESRKYGQPKEGIGIGKSGKNS